MEDEVVSAMRKLSIGEDGGVVTRSNPVPFVLPTGTVTFLLTDIEGSTAKWDDAPEAMAIAVARHYELLDDTIAAYGGVRPVEQGEGDSVVAAFSRASDAVAAAAEAQRLLTMEPWPQGAEIAVRMAVHTGEAQLRDEGNYFGQAVIRCARLRACAWGGQILVSQTVADLVAGRLDDTITLSDLGEHRLRDLRQPERVWQVHASGCRSEFAALRSLDAYPHNLPARTSPLIGREAELAELEALIVQERVVTVAGAGGCGKTRIACELAARVIDRFPGGVVWLEMAAHPDGFAVLLALAGHLTADGPDQTSAIVEALRVRRRNLLVLDNAEHILDSVASLVGQLVKEVPELTVLCTSREPLSVPGELVWRVPSLTTPSLAESDRIQVEQVSQFEAVQLFVERAVRARRGFAVTSDNAPAVAQICARLDGVPLAIELAAARIRSMSPARIANELDDRFRLLAGGPRTLLPRQQTLHASVAWSEGLLDDDERKVFRRLGVFAGGFTLAAAEAVVAETGDVDLYAVAELLGRLVDKSLVQWDDVTDRYSMLETIRSYAAQRLLDAGEATAVREDHADWCVTWAAEVSCLDAATSMNEWWHLRNRSNSQLQLEWPNLAAALEWIEPGESRALSLVASLGLYWNLRNGAAPSARYGMAALHAGDRHDPMWLEALRSLGSIRSNDADSEFQSLLEEARPLLEHAQDSKALLASVQWTLIRQIMYGGLTDDLLEQADHTLEQALTAGSWLAVFNLIQGPALQLAMLGRIDEARERIAGIDGTRADVINVMIRFNSGDLDGAEALAIRIGRAIRNGDGALMDLVVLDVTVARLAMLRCAPDQPLSSDGSTLEHHAAMLRDVIAYARMIREVAHGRFEQVYRQEWVESVALNGRLRERLLRAELAVVCDEPVDATRLIDEVHTLLAGVRAPLMTCNAALVEVDLARISGSFATARDHAHAALDEAHDYGLNLLVIDALEALGLLAHDAGRNRDAARLLGAAQAERDRIGYRFRYPHRAVRVESAVEQLRSTEFWAEGVALCLSDAVTIAQRGRGERVRPASGWESLTPAELEVVSLVASGCSNPQIAERLLMARATVKTHLNHVFTKLGVASRAELAALAATRVQ